MKLESKVVKAGAGAGKTTSLVELVLSFVEQSYTTNKEFPRLVLTTFTKKATQEIRERVIAAALKKNWPATHLRYLQSSARFQISTLHGICGLYLSRYGEALGLCPDFTVISSAERERLQRLYFREALSESQFQADFLVLTEHHGKYTDWCKEFKRMGDLQLFLGSFEVYSEQDWKRARASLFQQILLNAKSWLTEYQAFSGKKSEKSSLIQAALLEFANAVTPQGLQNDFETHLSRLKSKLITDQSIARAPFNHFLQGVRADLKEWFEHGYSFGLERKQSVAAEAFLRCQRHYQNWLHAQKIKTNTLEFDDFENLSLKLMQADPQSLKSFSADWDFWLLDEFQDTSDRQMVLLERFIGEQPFYMVGDPQQSIYAFRGGNVKIFEAQIAKVRDGAKGSYEEKSVNYRSHKEILNFVNEVFAIGDSNYMPMQAGRVEPKVANYVTTASRVQLHQVTSAELNSTYVLEQLVTLKKDVPSWGKICVLSRSKKHLRDLLGLLNQNDIPYEFHAGAGFYEQIEVQDALRWLRFLINPSDDLNFLSLVRSPFFRISDKEIFVERAGKNSLWIQMRSLENSTTKYLSQALADRAEQSLLEIWWKGVEDSGLLDFTLTTDPSGQLLAYMFSLLARLKEAEKSTSLLEFVDSKLEVDLEAEETIDDPVAAFSHDRLQLMTIHAAKGLEFDHVFVLGLDDGPPPIKQPLLYCDLNNKKFSLRLRQPDGEAAQSPFFFAHKQELNDFEVAESRRVFYVACTRAKESLHLWTGDSKARSIAHNWPLVLNPGLQSLGDAQYYVHEVSNSEPKEELPLDQLQSVTKLTPNESSELMGFLKPKQAHALESQSWSFTQSGKSDDSLSVSSGQVVQYLKPASRGHKIHKELEGLKYKGSQPISPELRSALVNYRSGLILDVIESGYVEWGFTLQFNNRRLAGQIDLWGYSKDRQVWIIDYKTGSPDAAHKALEQLEFYSWALFHSQRIAKDQSISICAFFPFANNTDFVKTLHWSESWQDEILKRSGL